MAMFGERLRELRAASGLTQQDVAVAAGGSVSSVTKLEAGDVDPSWLMALKLAGALGVSVAAFEGDGPAPAAKANRGRGEGKGKRT